MIAHMEAQEANGFDDVVRALEARRWDCLVEGDVDALEDLFDDGLAYTHSNGSLDTKASYLGHLRAGTFRYLSADVADVEVRVHGTTAVATGSARVVTAVGSANLTSKLRYTTTWTRSGQSWRQVSWHACPVAF